MRTPVASLDLYVLYDQGVAHQDDRVESLHFGIVRELQSIGQIDAHDVDINFLTNEEMALKLLILHRHLE